MEGIAAILRLAEPTPYGPIFRFMAYTGVRRGEALALKRENVDLDRAVAFIVATLQRVKGRLLFLPPKSAAGRRGIALDRTTVAMLRQHLGQQILHKTSLENAYRDRGLLFPGAQGEPLNPSTLSHNWAKLARKAGYLGVRLHDLRHAHAGGLIRAGEHAKVVQDRLGHSSAAFTLQVYGHLAAGLQERAAESFANLMSEAAGSDLE
jgi:integrase